MAKCSLVKKYAKIRGNQKRCCKDYRRNVLKYCEFVKICNIEDTYPGPNPNMFQGNTKLPLSNIEEATRQRKYHMQVLTAKLIGLKLICEENFNLMGSYSPQQICIKRTH